MVQFIQEVRLSLSGTSSVYENWNSFAAPYDLLFKPSMYSAIPLRATITERMAHAPVRNVSVGSTDLSTGHFAAFNESLAWI
jgi:hypothetical protein